MSKRGRKALTIPNIDWKIRVRSTLAAEVELLLLDPVRGRASYGDRSALINTLLEEWVEKQRKNVTTVQEIGNVQTSAE